MCGTCAVPHERPRGAGLLGGGRAAHDDRAVAQPAGGPRPGGRPRRSSARWPSSSRGSSGGTPYPGFPEPLSHKDMKNASKALDCIGCMCCYSACPVIGLGDLTDFAGPAPLVQLGQTALDPRNHDPASRALAGANRDLQLRLLLQVRGGLPGQHSDRQPGDRAAEGQGGAGARRWRSTRGRCARSSRCADASIRARWCCVRGLAALANLPRALRLLVRGKIDPIKTLLRRKTSAAAAAGRLLEGEAADEVRLLSGVLRPLDLRRAQRGDPQRGGPGSGSSSSARRGDLHRRARAARHRSGRLPHAQCAHPGARRARRPAADDDLQHLHAQPARRPCRLRR